MNPIKGGKPYKINDNKSSKAIKQGSKKIMQDAGAPTSVPSLTLMLEISLQIFIASVLDHKHIPQGLIMSISLPLLPSPLLYSPPPHIPHGR